MIKSLQFESIWDALGEDPVRVQKLKLRFALLIEITETLRSMDLTQGSVRPVVG